MKKKTKIKYLSTDEDRTTLLNYANNARRNDDIKFEILRFLMDSTAQGHINWGDSYHMGVYELLIKIGVIPNMNGVNLKKTKVK